VQTAANNRWKALLALALLCGCLCLGACTTVDLGPSAGVAPPCLPDEQFFAEMILPELIGKYRCRDKKEGGCHDSETGLNRTFSVYKFDDEFYIAGAPLPPNMQKTYDSVLAQVDCSDATNSPFITSPDGIRQPPHGGGKLFSPTQADGSPSPEVQLVIDWLAK
jgi:hypothetical protein